MLQQQTFRLEVCEVLQGVYVIPSEQKEAVMAGVVVTLQDVGIALCSAIQMTCLLNVREQQELRGISRFWKRRMRSAQDRCMEQRRRVLAGDLCVLLWRYTNRAHCYNPTPECCYVEFLMRSFLRYAQNGVRGRSPSEVTIAGSVGTALLMNELGKPRAWFPSDLDLFVRDRSELDRIQNAFRIGVMEKLGWLYRMTDSDAYGPGWDLERADEEEVVSMTDDDKEVVDSLRRTLPLAQAIGGKTRSRFVRAIMIRPIIPSRYESVSEILYLVRNINVTLLEFDPAPSDAVSFSELVRHGFDMAQCAVSVQVTEDLRFQCFCSDESREAVREQRIVLQRAEALRSSAPGSIRRVLQRVRKYRERGFEIAGYEMFKERLRGRCADERFI